MLALFILLSAPRQARIENLKIEMRSFSSFGYIPDKKKAKSNSNDAFVALE